MSDDVVIGILLLLLLVGSGGGAVAVTPLPRLDWHWPIPDYFMFDWLKYPAMASQEYQGTHYGQDMAYRRQKPADRKRFPPGTNNGTPGFFNPPDQPALSAATGQVASVQTLKTGLAVVIDHGGEWQTVYLHLATVIVKQGDTVRGGQRIGTTGWSPQDPERFRHLHFAIRYRGQWVMPTGQASWRRTQWQP